jgi:hypothetical protein
VGQIFLIWPEDKDIRPTKLYHCPAADSFHSFLISGSEGHDAGFPKIFVNLLAFRFFTRTIGSIDRPTGARMSNV